MKPFCVDQLWVTGQVVGCGKLSSPAEFFEVTREPVTTAHTLKSVEVSLFVFEETSGQTDEGEGRQGSTESTAHEFP